MARDLLKINKIAISKAICYLPNPLICSIIIILSVIFILIPSYIMEFFLYQATIFLLVLGAVVFALECTKRIEERQTERIF
ncbi:MAG TPA: hypothetical protein DDY52_04025 [Candidatus Moranbacteria bacterium]|nr:hypothetical protein [Candidatus Moranbacteria bacterium]